VGVVLNESAFSFISTKFFKRAEPVPSKGADQFSEVIVGVDT